MTWLTYYNNLIMNVLKPLQIRKYAFKRILSDKDKRYSLRSKHIEYLCYSCNAGT